MTKYEIEHLRCLLDDFLLKMGIDTHKSVMGCPVCCDKDGFHFLPHSNKQYWKCFSAKHSVYPRDNGDIFELVAQMENISYSEAVNKVADMYNLHNFEDIPKFKAIQTDDEPKPQKDRTQFYNMALQNQDKAIEYLQNQRGYVHSREIAQHYQIGYAPEYAYEFENGNPSKTTPAVIIPTSQYSYAWRSTTEPLKKKSGRVIPFNMECLQDTSKKWIFLVEGEFDALSFVDIALSTQNYDFSAISVNSANNLPRFLEDYICKNVQKDVTLIIALDNDTKEETNQAIKKYEDTGLKIAMMYKIPCIIADTKTLYLNQKDGNDALRNDRQAFFNAIQDTIQKAKNLDITQYMAQCDKLINEPQTTQNSNIITYEFNYLGEIDRAFDIGYSYLRYCHQTKTWYIYNGIKLEQDTTRKFINDMHKKINIQCKKEITHFKTLNNEELLKNARKEHKIAISKIGLYNAIEGIQMREPIAITLLELDKPNLLNCQNVTLDLEHLTAHQHRIEDFCTKLAPSLFGIELNPKYVEHWNRFLLDIMCGDESMVEFLQRACGYCLYPTNREECFFIFFGATTRNGKSTLLESIKNVLGDYAKAVSSATLSEKPTGKEANPEIISLIGTKLITCGELNSETLLNDTLLKAWIGNDTISARNLFDNNVLNFHLDGKLYANCNELPPMKNDDLLNSNRIIVIPFDRHFEEHEQNKDLKRLFSTPEYKAVILAWLIEGYKNYLKLGIKANMPERVIQAIDNYQSEANSINVFLNDEDIFERIDIKNYAEAVKITNKRLYSTYVDWCRENNCKPLSSANFKKQLRKNKAYSGANYKKQNGKLYKDILIGYTLKPSIIVTDTRNSNNPDRLVAIPQRELDKLKN